MTRGNDQQTKVIYKGRNDDFIVFIESIGILKEWKKDPSVPLSQVVNGWKIFCTHKQGAQGIMDGASSASLEGEFGTSNEDEVIKKIFQGGTPQTSIAAERHGDTNITRGATVPH